MQKSLSSNRKYRLMEIEVMSSLFHSSSVDARKKMFSILTYFPKQIKTITFQHITYVVRRKNDSILSINKQNKEVSSIW